jgi:hypothetical protein
MRSAERCLAKIDPIIPSIAPYKKIVEGDLAGERNILIQEIFTFTRLSGETWRSPNGENVYMQKLRRSLTARHVDLFHLAVKDYGDIGFCWLG